VEDSLVGFMFGNEYAWAGTHVIQWKIPVRIRNPYNRNNNTKRLRILSKDDEIEALRGLVRGAFRWQSLKLLADAYENRECFVNAYYVYIQLLDVDPKRGKEFFRDFLSRNYLKFAALQSVER
jgi:hypothetical protein